MIGDPGHLIGGQPQVERVHHRAHRGDRQVSLEMLLVVPLEGGHSLVTGDAELPQSTGQLRGASSYLRIRCAARTVAGPGNDLAVTVHGDAVAQNHAHGERSIHHRAVHCCGPSLLDGGLDCGVGHSARQVSSALERLEVSCMPFPSDHARDRPWVMRTYAGHSSARTSNALYRRNLAKGQTGLSVAFDLPTQTGYDPDHELARGEVGKVGVPISHIGDMRTLFDGIPLAQANTSMTINATAMWLLALSVAVAGEQGADLAQLSGTTQNDIIKEYLSRGTYLFPPGPTLRLITDMVVYVVQHIPKWNPINVCSYHLQEAGATPVQEVAYAMCTAIAVLDSVRDCGQVAPGEFAQVVGRMSFFVNAGVRFVEEMCKLRAFRRLWDETCRDRYGVTDPRVRRF